MKIAAIQHDIAWENPEENFAQLSPLIEKAADQGALLIVLSELFSTGFSMNTEHISEPPDGPSTNFLVKHAKELGVWVCGSAPILSSGNDLPHNCLVLANPDGDVLKYDKKHLFTFAEEDQHYVGGSLPLTINIEGTRCTFFVCFDLRFARDFWDLAPTTDLFVVIANWPETRRDHWKSLLKARAIENQSFVLGVNRIGEGDGLTYSGDSSLFNPLGEILAEAENYQTHTFFYEIEPSTVAAIRSAFPFR